MTQAILPARASLAYLKKLAKEKLVALRAGAPRAQLADAQLAIARERGFASWRKLRGYVQAARDDGARLLQGVRDGDVRIISQLLDRHPNLVQLSVDVAGEVKTLPTDTRAMRLLHIAVAANQVETARLLIQRGVDVNARNAGGRTPLHDCIEVGRDEIQQLLLDAGADVDVC